MDKKKLSLDSGMSVTFTVMRILINKYTISILQTFKYEMYPRLNLK